MSARRLARRREHIAPLEGRLVVILMDRTIRPQSQPLGRRIAERLDLPLDRATPGQYLLTIEATGGAREIARRDVRFAVR